ncbi:MAG: ISL3 family transposase [Planctomycetia bacterium]|nr:ISL3 family transposase [Planctomycetia bacterium]
MTVKDVAKDFRLDWDTVKTLDKEYMKKQLRRYPVAAPRVIGIDEISIRKGHTYRIVVSDLERGRPIWFGGKDRSKRVLIYLPVAWCKEGKEATVGSNGYVEGI